ncbi:MULTISPECIES: hypothetical protein [unclassified Sphingobacterium]|uniref:hypothetical protein n=1 Tax=unclassified Sphingobacterium TaxID=2609468 RepID=UPI0026005685|nr:MULTISPECIES: hypothetical protein [unclassified Sphingobacterium]
MMNINYDEPKDITNDAKEKEKELKKEGGAFGNTLETRPLSKAIVKEEEKKKSDQGDR